MYILTERIIFPNFNYTNIKSKNIHFPLKSITFKMQKKIQNISFLLQSWVYRMNLKTYFNKLKLSKMTRKLINIIDFNKMKKRITY